MSDLFVANVHFRNRLLAIYRAELADIEYCIWIRGEDLARYHENRTKLQAHIARIEREIDDNNATINR